jgi:tetratricopeptide (TPR) repeat protein
VIAWGRVQLPPSLLAMSAATTLFASVASLSCAPREGAKVKASQDIMEREQTPDKLFERGKGFASIGDLTRAEQYLTAALDRGGDAATITPVLLQVFIDGQRFRLAVEHCERALQKDPRNLRLRFLLGTLYNATGDPDLARAAFETVVEADPNQGEAHYSLAVLLREAHNIEAADRHFREYLRISPKGPHAAEARGSLLTPIQ